MLCRATQDGQVMVERSYRVWSTGEGNGKPLQYSCLENPMNSMKSESEVAQSCLILCDPMDCSLLGCSVHGNFQARVLEWGAIAFSHVRADHTSSYLSQMLRLRLFSENTYPTTIYLVSFLHMETQMMIQVGI